MSDLEFAYDPMGNRVLKRVITPILNGGGLVVGHDTVETWYVRDSYGQPMAVYEVRRSQGGDSLLTVLKEHPIYGSERLGLNTSEELIRVAENQAGEHAEVEPNWYNRALLIEEVMYDSPLSEDGVLSGTDDAKESHQGEYVVLRNQTDFDLSLGGYFLANGEGDTTSLNSYGKVLPGQVLVVGYDTSAGNFFGPVCQLPSSYLGEGNENLWCQEEMPLSDVGGMVQVLFQDGNGAYTVLDEARYGSFYGLAAENAHVEASLMDSLHLRDPVQVVRRRGWSWSLVPSGGGGVVADDWGVTTNEEPAEPEPIVVAAGRFELHRGQKMYELSNHLGNVLAVVADYKLLSTDEIVVGGMAVDTNVYLPAVLSLTDYYPFGMEMPDRVLISDCYRYGFNGQEQDDELNGRGNALAFKYRIHDPRIGRFLSVDPLEAEYPWNSTYAFAENDVIRAKDLEGAEKEFVTQEGNTVYGPYTTAYAQSQGWQSPIDLPTVSITDFAESSNGNKLHTWVGNKGYLLGPGVSLPNPPSITMPPGDPIKPPVIDPVKTPSVSPPKALKAGWFLFFMLIPEYTSGNNGPVAFVPNPAVEPLKPIGSKPWSPPREQDDDDNLTVFRGTTTGYPGSHAQQDANQTPVSTDPFVATVYASGAKEASYKKGNYSSKPIILINTKKYLKSHQVFLFPWVRSLEHDRELLATTTPLHFQQISQSRISLDQSRAILREMGYFVPYKVNNQNHLDQICKDHKGMTPLEIRTYIDRAKMLK